MPIYEFECQECKENFDKLMRITGVQQAVCPRCGSVKTIKKMSAFAANIKGGSLSSASSGSNCTPGGT
jgi:putative FmdB family regulatory protein